MQGDQRFTDAMEVNAEGHGELLRQVSNLSGILLAGVVCEHL